MSEEKKQSTAESEEKKGEAVKASDDSTSKESATKKQSKYFRTAKGKRRAVKQVPKGLAYIQSSLNNTIVTITDVNGNVLCWSSSGNCGFRGPKKATPYAAGKVVEKLATKAQQYGVKELSVFTKGIGNGRDAAVRSLNAQGFNITSMRETTPVPHNGCRARRPRRV
ncbi:30S ribosomal protein S11 [Candidatus Uhrbacteria bacterium]|jgi:small subunit ribosomal protein S11|nr:30S ribosomal protein S11 [Candidatus Uhrbacteria bacterium]